MMATFALAALASVAPAFGQLDTLTLLQSKAGSLPADTPRLGATFRQPLINFGDAQYVAHMTLGSQQIASMVDTGSSELVVFDSGCSSCGSAARYNPQLSATFREGILQNLHSFGSGSAFCTSAQEEVSIGPFHSANQTFWAAQSAAMPVLESAAFQAVLGLAPPEKEMVKAWQKANGAVQQLVDKYDSGELLPRSILDETKAAILVAQNVTAGAPMLRAFQVGFFSICLGGKPGSNGVLVWNDNSIEEHPQLFTRVPVSENTTWSVDLEDAAISGRRGTVHIPCPGGACTALLDTGSSLLAVPRSVKRQIEEALEDLDEDCSNLEVLPSLHFKLGEATVSLTPDTYVGKVNISHGGTPRTVLDRLPGISNSQHSCKLLLMETDGLEQSDKKPLWILGVPFFRKYYTTFELGASTAQRAVHIAPHTDDCSLDQAHSSLMLRGLEARTVETDRLHLPGAAAALGTVPGLRF